jgi:cobalt-zinc-cadmium efflux system protein
MERAASKLLASVPAGLNASPAQTTLNTMHMVATPNSKMQRVLQLSMVLTAAYVGATLYFGLRAHSLALISEAGHNVSDLLAIALSFVAVYFQARPATDQKTFG